MKIKYFDNNMILENEQVEVWMEEIEGSNARHDDIILHIFQLYHYDPDPAFCKYIQEKKTHWNKVSKPNGYLLSNLDSESSTILLTTQPGKNWIRWRPSPWP